MEKLKADIEELKTKIKQMNRSIDNNNLINVLYFLITWWILILIMGY
jgi:hypothetical protein